MPNRFINNPKKLKSRSRKMSFHCEPSWQKRSFAFGSDDRFQHSTKWVQQTLSTKWQPVMPCKHLKIKWWYLQVLVTGTAISRQLLIKWWSFNMIYTYNYHQHWKGDHKHWKQCSFKKSNDKIRNSGRICKFSGHLRTIRSLQILVQSQSCVGTKKRTLSLSFKE